MRGLLWLMCGVVILLPASMRAAEGDGWSAGVASVKLTPEKPVVLAGYASRTKPFEKVDLDLYAKALALRDAQGHRAVLVTMDLCIIPTEVTDHVRGRLVEQEKLEPAGIILSLSHTHSGPAVSLRPETAGPTGQPNPNAAGTVEYTKWLEERLVGVAREALGNLKPAKVSWGSGVAHFAMNRREFTDKGVILGVNPKSLVDRSVPVLRVDGADGTARAVVFGYACHGTTNPPNHLGVCPDYPGYGRGVIEEHFPGAQALFVAGCGGDANPYPRLGLADARKNGEELGREVCRVVEGRLAAIKPQLSCAVATAQLPLEVPERKTLEGLAGAPSGQRKQDAKEMLAKLDKGEQLPAAHPAPVVAWQFGGQDLTLVALPNEVVGYIPSRRILAEGGYETRGLYIGSGWFAPEVEEALVKAAQTAATSAGRTAVGEKP
jgi:hypothetical protein